MAPDASDGLAVREKVEQFLDAARSGNLELFKKLAKQLDDGKGLATTVEDVTDANDRGALHFAAMEGKTDLCKYLVEELDLDIDTEDIYGQTPVLHATREGHTATAQYLLEQGADPAIPMSLGATALHYAAGIGDIELVEFILLMGVYVDLQSVSGTPLIWAAGHAQVDAVKVLLEHNADPNAQTEDEITPLLSAIAAESLPCIEVLEEAGANVNSIAGGTTPLHVAVDKGSGRIIDFLLQAGADADAADLDGVKPIEVAATRGYWWAVDSLFLDTSRIQSVPEWSVDGIIEFMQSKAREQERIEAERKATKLKEPEDLGDLAEATPEAKKKAVDAKAKGDEAFGRKEFDEAIDAYTQAIAFDPTDATLYSERSLCWIHRGEALLALGDAKTCRALKPDWAKGCYREGSALRLLKWFQEAAHAFYEGVMLDPENREMKTALWEAADSGRKLCGANNQFLIVQKLDVLRKRIMT